MSRIYCISAIAFRDKAEKTKLEFLDSVLYQVFSKYVEIDGVPYVIEMLKKLDLETLIDKSESDKLVNQIFGLDDRIYRDVLTGADSRRGPCLHRRADERAQSPILRGKASWRPHECRRCDD